MTASASSSTAGRYIFTGITVLLLLILLISGCGSYNGMVASEEEINKAWGSVEEQYQRRADLIPNLVATVKGFATHEEKVLTEVVEARAKATQVTVSNDPLSFAQFESAQGELSKALSRLLTVVEAYPDLKSDQNFLALQSQIEGTENRIAVARGRYNEAVQTFNTKIRRFPARIYAGLFGFDEKPYFKSSPGSETAPKVEF